MYVTTELESEQPFRLQRAVLIYEEEGGLGRTYASVHPVEVARVGARPVLGAGKPVTQSFVRRLVRGLGQELVCEFLPDQVLYRSHDLIVWWTPAQTRTLFFRAGSELAKVDGDDFPIPPLVWAVNASGLSVRALAENARPRPETPLMVAPFWNTEPAGGGVCQGTMERPEERSPATIGAWVDGYFRAQFTHGYGGGRLTTHPKDVIGLWRELAGSKKPFPPRYLAPAHLRTREPETLQAFTTGRLHGHA